MKISLTAKNNLVHSLLIIILVSIIVFITKTNARYETYIELSGEAANFPETVVELSPDNSSYNIVPGEQIKIQYQVSNFIDEKINNNSDLQYYFELINENPLLYFKIRETPEIEDYANFDLATSMDYVEEKGYGAISLLGDGTSETKLFDVFFKCDENIDCDVLNLQLKLHAESKTIADGSLDMDKIVNLTLNIVHPENSEEPESSEQENQEQANINEVQQNQEANESQENTNEVQEEQTNNEEINESNEITNNSETPQENENTNEVQEQQSNNEEISESNEITNNSETPQENENTNEIMDNSQQEEIEQNS